MNDVRLRQAQSTNVGMDIGTAIGRANSDQITVRGFDLVEELLGELSYTEMMLLTITGHRPSAAAVRAVDAVLVGLVDHGMQPSALTTRMTYHAAPDSVQGAIAAGLLGAGSRILGSMEQSGQLLTQISTSLSGGESADQAVSTGLQEILASGHRIPGFGHGLHRDGDPRAKKLLFVADREGIAETEIELLRLIGVEALKQTGHELLLNVTGASAAILLGVGVPWQLHRGVAMISRTAGLVAHIGEEIDAPIAPQVRQMLRQASWIEES